MTIRALHLVKTGVGATWALRQMRELVKLGVDVHVALPPDATLAPAYQAAGVAVHPLQTSLPMGRPDRIRALLRDICALVDDIRPDILHSHFVGTTLSMRLALGRSHRLPRLFQVPGPLHLEHPLFRNMEIRTAGPADRWVGSCAWTCDRYRQSGIAPDRVFLSFYGSDLDEITPRAPGALRGELGLGPDVPIVGMVAFMYAPKRYLGQTRGLKGHEDLIDALEIVRRSRPDVVGVFVGGAWDGADAYERRVRAYAAERLGDGARFLGTRSDVPSLYPDISLAVHPSHSENLGGAAESLLLGVPTVATDVGGFPDIVRPGETGWLVPPHAPDRLAAAIVEALDDPAEARRRAAAGQVLTRNLLDVRRNAREIESIYRAVLGQS